MSAENHLGADVVANLSGVGYGASLDVMCSLDEDMQWKCPDAVSYSMPMKKGDRCYNKDGCYCHKLAAHLRAVSLLKELVGEWERKLVEEMENSD